MQERYPKRNCDSTHLIFRHYFANLKKPRYIHFSWIKKINTFDYEKIISLSILYYISCNRRWIHSNSKLGCNYENERADNNLNEAITRSDTEEPLKDGKYYLASFISYTYIRWYNVSPIFNQIISSIQKKLVFVLI